MKRTVIFVLAFVVAAAVCFAEETAEGNSPNASADLGAVVVTAGIYPSAIWLVSGSFEVIGAEDMELYGLDTIADVLDTVGGAYVKRYGGGSTVQGLVMRGAYSRQNTIMMDGIPMGKNLIVGDTDLSLYDISGAEKVEVIKGDMSSLLGGNAVGGVINIITGKGNGKTFTQDASYGTFDTKKFVTSLNFNVLGADVMLTGVDESSAGYITNSDYKKNVIKGSLDYASGVYDSKLTAFYVKREMGAPGSITYPSLERQFDENFNAAVDNNIKLDFMDVRIKGFMNRSDLVYYGRTRAGEYNASVAFSTEKVSPFLFEAGYETSVKDVESAWIGNHTVKNNAIVAAATAKFLEDALELGASARFDNNTSYDNVLSGGFNVSYLLMKELKAFAGVRTGFSEPTIGMLYTPPGDPYALPNPDLVPETSLTYETGAKFDGNTVRAEAVMYYRDVKNIIINQFPGGKAYPVNLDAAGIFGVDASAGYYFGKDAGITAEYSLLLGNDAATGDRLPYMPMHKASGRAFVKLFEKLSVSATAEFTGDRIAYGTTLVGGYFLAHAKAAYDINENVSVSIDVHNIYDNKDYQNVLDYAMPGREVTVGVKAEI